MKRVYIDEDRFEKYRLRSTLSLEGIFDVIGKGSRQTIRDCITKGCTSKTVSKIAAVLKVEPWWDFLDKEGRDMFDPDSSSTLILRHRQKAIGQEYFQGALGSARRVVLSSIMTEHTFEDVDESLHPDTKLNVLTWNPESIEEIYGFAKHLGERGDKVEQTRGAISKWDDVAEKCLNVSVFTYTSTPTMQGVLVEDKWALIELLPYHTDTEFRPALLLKKDRDDQKEAFEFFAKRFEALLKSATLRETGERKPPNWENKK